VVDDRPLPRETLDELEQHLLRDRLADALNDTWRQKSKANCTYMRCDSAGTDVRVFKNIFAKNLAVFLLKKLNYSKIRS
jgi:hypothetical protein